jgi:hypothetical protein
MFGLTRCLNSLTRPLATNGSYHPFGHNGPSAVANLLCARKNVIIAAYSNAHPQTAAAWSANITTWGESLLFNLLLLFRRSH